MNLFELFVKIGVDDQASKKISDIAGSIGNGLKTAADVGIKAVGAMSAATVAFTGALAKGITSTAEYGDNIDKMSQKMGLSAEAYQEWDFIMQHSGTSMEALKAGMKTLANAVESGNGAFERLGITQEEIAAMNQEELFARTLEGLQGVTDETERTYLAGQLLGRGATELGALLNTSAEDVEAMRQQVHDLGGVMSNEAVKASAGFQDSLQNAKTALTGVKNNLMSDFLPSLSLAMDGLAKIFSGDKSGLGELNDGVEKFTEKLSDFAPKVIESFGNIFGSIGLAITKSLPKLAKAAVEMVKSFAKSIKNNAKTIVKVAKDLILTFIDGMVDMLPDIIEAAAELLGAIVEAIPEVVVKLAKAVPKIIEAIASGLEKGIEAVGGAIVNLFTGAADRAEQSRQRIESMLSFGDLMEEATKSMTDVTKMMSEDGKTLEEIGDIIEQKESQITTIIKTSKENNKKLRDEEIQDIKKYIEEIRQLEGQKLSIYQSRQAAYSSLFESFAEGGFTTEELAEGLGKTEQAMEDALAALDEYYVSQVQTIGLAFDLGSKEYKEELEKLNKWRKEEESKIKKQQRESVDLAIEIIGQTAVGKTKQGEDFLFVDFVKTAQNTLNEVNKYKSLTGQKHVTGQELLRDTLAQTVSEEVLQTAGALFSTIAEGVQSGFTFSQETKNLASTLIESFFSEYSESEVALEAARKIAEGLEGEVSELENVYNMSAEEIGEVLKKRLIEKMKIKEPEISGGFQSQGVTITQNIYSPVNSAADLMSEAVYQANKEVLGFG